MKGIQFLECRFVGCNLSLAQIADTQFQDCIFTECKLLGLHFELCNPFGLAFTSGKCTFDQSSFSKRKLKGIQFKDSSLKETDFTEADLSGSVFDNCDLARATFDRTNLEKTDFRTAYNYSIDPQKNRIKKARFSVPGITGLLDVFDIKID